MLYSSSGAAYTTYTTALLQSLLVLSQVLIQGKIQPGREIVQP